MTKNKAQKRDIRARQKKTGESYTAARSHVIDPPDATADVDFGTSEDAVRQGTGRGWNEWLAFLDTWGATQRTHTEIARFLREDVGVSGWWAQTVTVGYERARGMRAPHQTSRGFEVGVSKTLPVERERVYRAFVDARRRNRWLESGKVRIRTKTEPRLVRFDVGEDGSRLVVTLDAMGPAKTRVHLSHERLSGPYAVEPSRAFWKERLAALAELLQ